VKISVIGVGHVGSIVGFLLASRGLASEIVLCCSRETTDDEYEASLNNARGVALDIEHAIAFTPHRVRVNAGGIEETADSQIIVMTASVPRPTKAADRAALGPGNAKLMRRMIPLLANASHDAIIVNVTNPVDALTYQIFQLAERAWFKVMGTGTLIDTQRFRRLLSHETNIHAVDLRTYILGEHGDGQFATWTHATTGGMRFGTAGPSAHRSKTRSLIEESKFREIEAEVRGLGTKILNWRGQTTYAVAVSVERIVDNIVNDLGETCPVSVVIDGFMGVKNVCLSVPCVVGRKGIRRRLEPELGPAEKTMFRKSAQVVKSVIQKMKLAGKSST
jgi:L-lactate dehydrogenase